MDRPELVRRLPGGAVQYASASHSAEAAGTPMSPTLWRPARLLVQDFPAVAGQRSGSAQGQRRILVPTNENTPRIWEPAPVDMAGFQTVYNHNIEAELRKCCQQGQLPAELDLIVASPMRACLLHRRGWMQMGLLVPEGPGPGGQGGNLAMAFLDMLRLRPGAAES